MKNALITVLLLLLFLAFAAATLSIETEKIDTSSLPSEVTSILTSDRLEQAIIFSDFRDRWYFFSTFFTLAVLAAILWFGFFARLKKLADRLTERLHGQTQPVAYGCVLFLLAALLITFATAGDKQLVSGGNILFAVLWGGVGFLVGKYRRFAASAFFILIFSALLYIIDLPLSYYRDFVVEHHFGLSTKSFGEWFADGVKSTYLSTLFLVLLIPLAYKAMARFSRSWWIWVSAAFVPIMILVMIVVPVFVQPLFNKFEPLKDQALAERILGMARQAGIEGGRVYQVNMSEETTKINAYVTGLHGSQRIVLWDTTLEKLRPDEIAFVMAHEMGHYVMTHIWIGIAIFSVIFFVLLFIIHKSVGWIIRRFQTQFGFSALTDIASLPLLLLMLSLLMFVLDPITNGYSRSIEHDSDAFGLAITKDGVNAASAFVKLANENLSNPKPSTFMKFWLYDHPPLLERIEFCRAYAAANPAPTP